MISKKRGLVEWLEFEIFQDFKLLKQGVFLRKGGLSDPPFDSLNLSLSVEDENAPLNRHLIKELLEADCLISAKQCHGTRVIEVKKETAELADALTTKILKKALLMTHADCQIALFYDPIHHAIGAAHAGWKGNVQNIYKETLLFMHKQYGSRPEEMLVGISPSLRVCHAAFVNYRSEFPESFWRYKRENNHFDLVQLAVDQLVEAGVQESNIECAPQCTYCNPQDFFSYRRDQITGRNGTVIMLA